MLYINKVIYSIVLIYLEFVKVNEYRSVSSFHFTSSFTLIAYYANDILQ